jgi:hypothetical protein
MSNGPSAMGPIAELHRTAACQWRLREPEGLNLKSASNLHPRAIYVGCVPVAQGCVLIVESLNALPKPRLQQTLKMVVCQRHGAYVAVRIFPHKR